MEVVYRYKKAPQFPEGPFLDLAFTDLGTSKQV
jgi:hypothetical protein